MAELVSTPTLTPPRYGLLSVADIIPDSGRWINGVEYYRNPPADAATADDVDCDDVPATDLGDDVPRASDKALRVHSGFTVKHPGLTPDEIHAYARGRLANSEGPAVERKIWPKILTGAATPAGAAAVSLLAGIGALEGWLYDTYGGTGVIHVPRSAVPYLKDAKQLVETSGRLTTILGTRVAAGAYPGTDSAGAAPAAGATWIAATPAVQIRRSDTRVRTVDGYFDHRTNNATGIADRLYIVGWENLSAAVQITLEGTP
ncbi:hypothetical protein JVX90_00280 [Gordonia sp. PDNC005]|uniref:hypothetical protein n=1 Tax=Gordonia sp. PDNC005 TaxID=2811424 RepID=UPI001964DD93|nr:hypothetical protein [Gordonia sp. PDNC005]QRY62749.1 hypothetical protein JVX90_00280 [Gordonia sp. PDNC005]